MSHVTTFQVVDHGEDGSQYFPGCGVAYTPFNHCVTGVGDTAREALEDALNQMATIDHETNGSMDENMLSFLQDPDKNCHADCDPEWHDSEEGHDWHHYVSVRYNVEGDAP